MHSGAYGGGEWRCAGQSPFDEQANRSQSVDGLCLLFILRHQYALIDILIEMVEDVIFVVLARGTPMEARRNRRNYKRPCVLSTDVALLPR
jgi:hypothetical protein